MLINAQVRPYRYQGRAVRRRQWVARSQIQLSASLQRAVGTYFWAALLAVMVCSQLLHWGVTREAGAITRLEVAAAELQQENRDLRAEKKQLLTTAHIKALAAARFALHEPAREQVHRL